MISAIICTYNREKYLGQVLDSLLIQTLSKSQFEIIVVNNNSPGNTEEIVTDFIEKHKDVNTRYFLETNQGLSFARNRGIVESEGEYLTFVDDDAFLDKEYLEKICHYFENEKDVAAIGSKVLLHYESIVPAWENKYMNSLLGYFNIGDERLVFNRKNYPRGSNMSFRSDVFEKVGNFNVKLGRIGKKLTGGEEKDLFQRIYKQNLQVIYVPDAIVYHCVPIERTTSNFIKKQALGTGASEWQRVTDEGKGAVVKRIFQELIKWGGSIVLFWIYLFKIQPAKGIMIMRFRYWVSLGMIKGV